jgi:peptidoglycan/LPS O-acetylase OafA/YrhL
MTDAQTKRDVGPDLLRAIAILLVMVWHLPKASLPEVMLEIRKFGWLGVDIFFVLSGYLIVRLRRGPPCYGVSVGAV